MRQFHNKPPTIWPDMDIRTTQHTTQHLTILTSNSTSTIQSPSGNATTPLSYILCKIHLLSCLVSCVLCNCLFNICCISYVWAYAVYSICTCSTWWKRCGIFNRMGRWSGGEVTWLPRTERRLLSHAVGQRLWVIISDGYDLLHMHVQHAHMNGGM